MSAPASAARRPRQRSSGRGRGRRRSLWRRVLRRWGWGLSSWRHPLRLWRKGADRWWHRASTGLLCLSIAQVLGWAAGWSPARQVVCLAIGAAFGGGRWSPDVDQYGWWRSLDERLPDEVLGHRGPLAHHGITHWPGTAVLIGVTAGAMASPAGLGWAGLMIGVAWLGHQAGDVLLGYGGRDVSQGIPLMPWWHHYGLGLGRSGGPLGVVLTVVCWALIGWRLSTLL